MSKKEVRLVTATVQVILHSIGHSMAFVNLSTWGKRVHGAVFYLEGNCSKCKILVMLRRQSPYDDALWDTRIGSKIVAYIDKDGNEIFDKRAIPISSWCTKYRNLK